ncbi:MAG TPA: low affinity iron permease family protein [Cyclobacteriaceae bacterium]
MKPNSIASDNADVNASKHKSDRLSRRFEIISNLITRAAGRPATSLGSIVLVLLWAASGPFFDYSENWQLIINTSTTIITFLMVFVIQTSQNKDTIAVQIKLNELIAANRSASNRIIDVEDLTAAELEVLKKFYVKLAELAENESDLFKSHSIDEAKKVHRRKKDSLPPTGTTPPAA